jgi:hypothetical protein
VVFFLEVSAPKSLRVLQPGKLETFEFRFQLGGCISKANVASILRKNQPNKSGVTNRYPNYDHPIANVLSLRSKTNSIEGRRPGIR